MQYKCRKCGGNDVRQQVSMLVNPNSQDWHQEFVGVQEWEWDDFSYCLDCEDSTILDEVEENQKSD